MGFKTYTGYEKKVVPVTKKEKRKPIPFPIIECKECRKKVQAVRKKQLFCTSKCRIDNWMKSHPRITIQVTLTKE